MMWIVIVAITVLVAIPPIIMWGLWQLEKLEIGDIEWRDED